MESIEIAAAVLFARRPGPHLRRPAVRAAGAPLSAPRRPVPPAGRSRGRVRLLGLRAGAGDGRCSTAGDAAVALCRIAPVHRAAVRVRRHGGGGLAAGAADACAAAVARARARGCPCRTELAHGLAGPGRWCRWLGSLITEPAAMTIAALMLAPHVFRRGMPERLKYLALGVLFVNVSIGGTLTSYAAPPVLMVAGTWGWDTGFMLAHLRLEGGAGGAASTRPSPRWLLRRHLRDAPRRATPDDGPRVPATRRALIHLRLPGGGGAAGPPPGRCSSACSCCSSASPRPTQRYQGR